MSLTGSVPKCSTPHAHIQSICTYHTYMLIPECVQGHRIVCVVVLCILLCVLCRLKNWMKTWCASFPTLPGATCARCRLWWVGFAHRRWWRPAVESSTRSTSGYTLMLWSAFLRMAVLCQKRNANQWVLLQCFSASCVLSNSLAPTNLECLYSAGVYVIGNNFNGGDGINNITSQSHRWWRP